MALGDGIRRNIKTVDPAERLLLIDAFKQLNSRYFAGTRSDTPPGGVSWWFKQDEIHQATHVHGGPEFLPWHRVIVNRLEEMLRQINPQLSLHYWDWTEDPRNLLNANLGGGSTGILNLFTPSLWGYGGFMTASIGEPWLSAGFYDPNAANKRDTTNNPADPPGNVLRSVGNLISSPASVIQNNNVITAGDYAIMRGLLENIHNNMHNYVNMGDQHISFRDPFVFLLHSNVDRVFAMWQFNNPPVRLVPATVYGTETNLDVTVGAHIQNVSHLVEPWSTGHSQDSFGVSHVTRPWSAPENEGTPHTYMHQSVVSPPCYDTIQPQITFETPNVDFGNIPAGLTSFRAVRIKVASCQKIKFQITQNPSGNFAITPMGNLFTFDPMISGAYGDAFVWVQFTANGTGLQNTIIKVQALDDTANPQNIGTEETITLSATAVPRTDNSIVMVLDRSGSMNSPAGITATRATLLKTAVGVFTALMRPSDEIGIVSFDDQVATLLPMTPCSTGLGQVNALLMGHGLDPRGATGIGIGIQQGNSVLAGATSTFNKAMLVLTDGNENVHPYINQLPPGTITAKTYAIGFGLPGEVSTGILNQITNNTHGDLVVTGNITTDEQKFLLTKYFVQILNGISNNQIILDPQGNLLWGAVHTIPFVVSEADVSLECIALCPVPLLLSFTLETPDGKIINPSMSGARPNIEYINGREIAFYRIMLPALPANPAGTHAGTWKAILQIKSRNEIENLLKQQKINKRELAAKLSKTLPYNFMAQCYSNLVFTAKSVQTSLEPGAVINIQATLKEYDVPMANRASVTADVTRPDLSTATITLKETGRGLFETEFKTTVAGNYLFRLFAKGTTINGRFFTREKTVTAAVFIGGDKYHDNTNFTSWIDLPDGRDRRVCELINCIFSHGVINEKLEKTLLELGIDLKNFRECLKKYCFPRKHTDEKLQGIESEKSFNDPDVMAGLQRPGSGFIFSDETFGFAKQPEQGKKETGKN